MKAVLVYGKVNPIHLACLRRAMSRAEGRGDTLVVLAVADSQREYNWPPLDLPADGSIRTLYSGREYWDLSYREIHGALVRSLTRLRPDVVVLPGWGFKESLSAMLWCLRKGVPRVVIADSLPHGRSRAGLKNLLRRLFVRGCQSALVAGTPHVRYLGSLGLSPDRCFMGCDVIDNGRFQAKRWTREDGPPLLLSVTRLIPEKNLPAVLPHLAAVPEWNWLIAGEGPQKERLLAAIERYRLGERVRLLGHIDYYQVPALYQKAHVYLQPSLSDTWGLAVNEAMASGLPVLVSTRCGCQEDLVWEGRNGFTFDPAGPALGELLVRMLEMRSCWPRMGRASRQIIRKWNPDLFARNFWRACEVALRRGPAPLGTSPSAADENARLAHRSFP